MLGPSPAIWLGSIFTARASCSGRQLAAYHQRRAGVQRRPKRDLEAAPWGWEIAGDCTFDMCGRCRRRVVLAHSSNAITLFKGFRGLHRATARRRSKPVRFRRKSNLGPTTTNRYPFPTGVRAFKRGNGRSCLYLSGSRRKPARHNQFTEVFAPRTGIPQLQLYAIGPNSERRAPRSAELFSTC